MTRTQTRGDVSYQPFLPIIPETNRSPPKPAIFIKPIINEESARLGSDRRPVLTVDWPQEHERHHRAGSQVRPSDLPSWMARIAMAGVAAPATAATFVWLVLRFR